MIEADFDLPMGGRARQANDPAGKGLAEVTAAHPVAKREFRRRVAQHQPCVERVPVFAPVLAGNQLQRLGMARRCRPPMPTA